MFDSSRAQLWLRSAGTLQSEPDRGVGRAPNEYRVWVIPPMRRSGAFRTVLGISPVTTTEPPQTAARPHETIWSLTNAVAVSRGLHAVAELAVARVHTLDVIMLAVTGGRERTVQELSSLLEAAGFRATRTVETDAPIRLLEAIAV